MRNAADLHSPASTKPGVREVGPESERTGDRTAAERFLSVNGEVPKKFHDNPKPFRASFRDR
jgi:hypothetical protein